MKKAIISVIGEDKVGIIYGVTKILLPDAFSFD